MVTAVKLIFSTFFSMTPSEFERWRVASALKVSLAHSTPIQSETAPSVTKLGRLVCPAGLEMAEMAASAMPGTRAFHQAAENLLASQFTASVTSSCSTYWAFEPSSSKVPQRDPAA